MARQSDTAQDLYLTGLRNAHALENEALSIMQRQIERLENYPEVLAKLKAHSKETEKQRQRLREILDELGDDPSTLKDLGGSLLGNIAAIGQSVAGDEIIKSTFANYAFENYEIAAYKSLICLAEATNHPAHLKLLEQSLGEEIAMASWIEENVEAVTLRFLKLSEKGKKAKV